MHDFVIGLNFSIRKAERPQEVNFLTLSALSECSYGRAHVMFSILIFGTSRLSIFLSQLIAKERLQPRFRHESLTVNEWPKKENEFYHCLHYQRPTENNYSFLRNINLYEKSKVCIYSFVS